jgi:hypothetical protein
MQNVLQSYAILADSLKKNAFDVKEKNLRSLFSEIWSDGQLRTCIVHLGENIKIHSQVAGNGIKMMVIGDQANQLVTIFDYGTNLRGFVSVHVRPQDSEEGLVHLIMTVFPVTAQSEPLFGTIWMDDLQSIGACAKFGHTAAFSINQLLIPNLKVSNTAFVGTLNQFSLGITTISNFNEDSRQILSQFFGDATVITPFGMSQSKVSDVYPLTGYQVTKKPAEMTDNEYAIISTIFEEGVSISSQAAVRTILKKKDLDDEEIANVIHILNGMVKKNTWLDSHNYAENIYYIPSPRLLVSL